MPLVAWPVIAYLVGLLAGFGGLPGFVAIVLAVVAIVVASRDNVRAATVLGFAVAGLWSARSAKDSNERCIRRWAATREVVARLDRDIEPGGFSSAELTSCRARISIFAAQGSAPAGSVVRVGGTIVVAGEGSSLSVQAAGVTLLAPPSLAARLRASALRQTDAAFGEDAPMARALVLADMRDLPPEVRDRWATAGLAHMLSVSGLHVGIIAAVVELLLGAARVKRRYAPIVAVIVIAVYVVIIGLPPPAVRAAAMLSLRGICRLAQRSVSPWAFLALGAAQPFIDSWSVLDIGYQLSVIGVSALIVGSALVKRLELRGSRAKRAVLSALAITTIASIASAPLVAWSFGRVSLVAPISNLLADPIVGVTQPILFLAVLLGPVRPVAAFIAGAAHPLLYALDGVAGMAASVPGGSVTVWPSTPTAIAAGIMAICVLVACVHDRPARPLIVAAAGAIILVFAPARPSGEWTEVHMIDVGQGDAIAIHTRRDHWILIDAGRVWPGGDAGTRTVVPYIAHQGGRLTGFILTHPHADHVGGAASVLDALHPVWYFDAAFVTHNQPYDQSLLAARRDHTRWSRVHPGQVEQIDEVGIRFLAPDSAFEASLPDPNNASTVALVTVGARRFLFMGDAEREEEEWLLAHEPEWLRADVLKVGHHGSSTSSTGAFLDSVRPTVALVSVGFHNSYGHPSAAVMADLARRGAQVLRTDQLGTVVLETNGSSLQVRAR